MANTFLLDPDTWDLLEFNGNIAFVGEPYSLAQDAASEIQTFLGEVFYDTTQGVNYGNILFGPRFNINYIKAQLTTVAMLVPDVVSATVTIQSLTNRVLSGQVHVTNQAGQASAASFTVALPQFPSPSPFGT